MLQPHMLFSQNVTLLGVAGVFPLDGTGNIYMSAPSAGNDLCARRRCRWRLGKRALIRHLAWHLVVAQLLQLLLVLFISLLLKMLNYAVNIGAAMASWDVPW